MPQIDIIFEDERWKSAAFETLAQAGCTSVFETLSLRDDFEISVLACDDARIGVLNGDFRQKPTATNVLSWPSADRGPAEPGGQPSAPDTGDLELGDIAISYDTCLREVTEQGKSFDAHITHLMIHATLHLLGYDHETDQDAALMENLETRILAKLGIEDPY